MRDPRKLGPEGLQRLDGRVRHLVSCVLQERIVSLCKKPAFHWWPCQSKQVLVSAWKEALGAREEKLLSENPRAKTKRARAISE